MTLKIKFSLLISITTLFAVFRAEALPAFARRENVSCTICHTNGSAGHLTEFGYIYRRMAFHWPGRLGDEKADESALNVTNHFAVGVNVIYKYVDSITSAGDKTISSNGINVPEVEIWPLVGGFFGHWGIWSELDSVPPTNTDGKVVFSLADIRYAAGSPDLFFNFRAGMIAPEGYGASDQWFDDGNIPLMDSLSANYNQNTFVNPWGAMRSAELGFEFGVNYLQSHLTLGLYNGFTALVTNPDGSYSAAPSLLAATTKRNDASMRDLRVQWDQFFGSIGAITVGYYTGSVPQADPIDKISFTWLDHYSQARLYLTGYAVPSVVDILAGIGYAKNQYVTNNSIPAGDFEGKSGFIGANWYAHPNLTLGSRIDKYYFNATDSATGYSVQASFPFENKIFIFHINQVASTLSSGDWSAGWNTNLGLALRFLL